eukprot:TRINITY_DN17296_c0_g1_i6.p1 TRINITY_DN17296_c0_g1~~TRINITY_DN17296_c0_g1_i6.p1  ORF type:complete len:314 (-),score=92.14 TRINITY_DN17296_c0_g1_i6:59-1000(-)
MERGYQQVSEECAVREGVAGDLFRSQPMKFVRITVSTDPNAARDAVTKLVETDSVMFLDDMEAVTGESRRFKREVFQCNESKRVLRYLTAEVNAYLDVDPDGQRSRELFAGNVPPPPEMSSIEVLLETLSEYEQSVSYNTRMIRAANTKINHKREHQLVLEKCSTVLEQVTAPLDGPPSMSQGVQLDSFSKEPVDTESQSLLESGLFHSKLVMHECGIISTEKEERFKQVLFRTCRSNVVTKTIPIDEKLLDYVTGEPVSKVAFIIFVLSLIHISEPTRLLSISYAVFCLKKKKKKKTMTQRRLPKSDYNKDE